MKYIIIYQTGAYSDHSTQNVLCCDTEAEANARAEEYNNRLKSFGLHEKQEEEEDGFAYHPEGDPPEDFEEHLHWLYDFGDKQAEAFRESVKGQLPRLRIDSATGGSFYVMPVREVFDAAE